MKNLNIMRYLNLRSIIWTILLILSIVSYHLVPRIKLFLDYNQVTNFQLLFFIIGVFATIKLIGELFEQRILKIFESESELISKNIHLAKVFTNWIFYGAALGLVFYKLGVSLSSITLYFGLFGTAIAFAFRDIFFSIMVWFLLESKITITPGTYIDLGEHKGTIIENGAFFTIIAPSHDKKQRVIVPTKSLFEKGFSHYGSKQLIPAEEYKLPLVSIKDDFSQQIQKAIISINNVHGMKVTNHKVIFELNQWYLVLYLVTKKDEPNTTTLDKVIFILIKEGILIVQNSKIL